MRRMADSVNPTNCPPGFDLYLGYVNGRWPSYRGLVRLYPGAVHVPCTVTADDDTATVLDVEAGDATPGQAPVWVMRRRAAGCDPTVYCSLSAWPTVRAAFTAAGVAEPHWLVAGYATPPDRSIPPGAIGHQFADWGPYDESAVADYWPGVDPPPTTQRIAPMHNPPWVFEPIVADLACPTGGAWALAASGAVYALGGAPFRPWPTRAVDFAGRSAARLEPGPDGAHPYTVVDTSGERYSP